MNFINILEYFFISFKKSQFLLRDLSNRIKHGPSCPKSASTIIINPQDVKYYTCSSQSGLTRRFSGRIISGDWDLKISPIESSEKFKACKEHFVYGKTWADTGVYDSFYKRLETRKKPDGCANITEFENRYHNLDTLYHSLKDGKPFLKQKELKGRRSFREYGGILIHLDRYGNPIFGSAGWHRLCIAKILGLTSIPAQLGVVHKEAVDKNLLTIKG